MKDEKRIFFILFFFICGLGKDKNNVDGCGQVNNFFFFKSTDLKLSHCFQIEIFCMCIFIKAENKSTKPTSKQSIFHLQINRTNFVTT